jgi:hypothetical protein
MIRITLLALALSTLPASADYLGGGPHRQNGMCWKASKTWDGMFGYWKTCPKEPNTAAFGKNTPRPDFKINKDREAPQEQ